LLGPPVVKRDGVPVTFDTRKAIALLALLAVTGREHTREQVADLLWPDADDAKARGSLRRTLSVAAAAVGPALTISRTTVGLLPGAVDVDVREFETLLSRSAADAAALERGVGLYRGDFLAGFTVRGCPEYEDWQAAVSYSPGGCSGWSPPASRRENWSARSGTPASGSSWTRCTSRPTRR